ncbi:unnamed protein product [Microthlaspi erraticum]|uniref:RNase H type-1 domain-containing protein n=1 Tax=Microthlaspi erraticum TaxID=1685480 RepID=A0A6D2HYL0_9BRAS|nr:unnamed protein product [Microthlaspi erraticum]
MGSYFERVWRVAAPERVCLFLWLVSHQVIMTNVERKRRHLSDSDVCSVCKGDFKTIMHVLRDFPAMAGIWERIVPAGMRHLFFSQSLLEWLYDNLQEGVIITDVPWSTTFAMAVWWGWKWRCGNVFGDNRLCRDRVKFVRELAAEVWRAYQTVSLKSGPRARVVRDIGWQAPSAGCFKLNTDGASHGNPGLATAGGVIRDGDGKWCGGFALNIGRCTAPLAELWGVYYGLVIAWERKFSLLEFEVDSELVVGFLKRGINTSHLLSFLVRLCHGYLEKDWSVRITHVFREANRLADSLANHAFSLPLGFHLFEHVPPLLESLRWEDEIAVTSLRLVSL